MTRARSRSPFPNAYKVIAEAENERTATIPAPPLPELLAACTHQGVTCAGCGTFDDLGFDWNHAVVISDEGDLSDEWYCKLCFKRETSPLPYKYKARVLDNAVDEPFRKKKKP